MRTPLCDVFGIDVPDLRLQPLPRRGRRRHPGGRLRRARRARLLARAARDRAQVDRRAHRRQALRRRHRDARDLPAAMPATSTKSDLEKMLPEGHKQYVERGARPLRRAEAARDRSGADRRRCSVGRESGGAQPRRHRARAPDPAARERARPAAQGRRRPRARARREGRGARRQRRRRRRSRSTRASTSIVAQGWRGRRPHRRGRDAWC